jgi:hypothetical protein
VPRLLVGVVVAELTFDLVALIWAIATRNTAALPGALLRTAVMGYLSLSTLLKRRPWARIAFVALEYFTAATALVLTFVVPGGGLRFGPKALAVFFIFLTAAVTASIGKLETP